MFRIQFNHFHVQSIAFTYILALLVETLYEALKTGPKISLLPLFFSIRTVNSLIKASVLLSSSSANFSEYIDTHLIKLGCSGKLSSLQHPFS